MKTTHLFKLAFAGILFSIFTFTSGVQTVEQPKVDHYKIMTDYMKANNLDLSNMTSTWVTTASAVNAAGASTFYIIDLRSAADFAAGRIEGAVNSTLANVLTTAQSATKPILLVCYTGQTAAVAHVALRLSGYSDCKILKWGMSSWNSVFDKWTANISDQAVGNANWSSTNSVQTPVLFSLPELDETQFTAADTTGAVILAKRVSYMLSLGLKGVNAADVLATPTNYFIVNYWADADVTTYGHIVGAYRLNETLLLGDGMKNLDPASKVTVYCWTGQTSALVSAYLNVLGYDAYSIKFGANSMINSSLQKNKFSASEIGNYTYVTGN